MISVIGLHLLAGAVTGAVFTVRTLLLLVGVSLAECLLAALMVGYFAVLCSIGGLVALQIGYLSGIVLRAVLEHNGIAEAPSHQHHQR